MTDFDAYRLTALAPNHFGYGGIDRDHLAREQHGCPFDFLSDRLSQAQIVPLWNLRNFFLPVSGPEQPPSAGFVPADVIGHEIIRERALIYLGQRRSGGQAAHLFALDFSDLDDEAGAVNAVGREGYFNELREVDPMIDGPDGSVLAYARAMIYWHKRHLYCGRCGQPTSASKLGHQRSCVNTDCGEMHFPRTDPAVIMLVTDRRTDRVLLGRQAIWPEGMYSTLAGFVEPGETIEYATAREVFEEVGIQITNVRYQHSQPWPFPSSLMLGLYADALTTELNINTSEIQHAGWFTRDELLNFSDQNKFLPRKLSISRRLIDDWLATS